MSRAAAGGGRRDVRELLDRFLADSGAELSFVRHRTSGTVHIVLPTLPPHELADDLVDEPREFAIGDTPADVAINLALGIRSTLCPYVAAVHRGGHEQGDQPVTEFDDIDLCRRCYQALGEHTARAFEHPQPGRAQPATE